MAAAKETASKQIVIEEFYSEALLVRIRGLSPYLSNRFSKEKMLKIETKQQGGRAVKEDRDPQKEFEQSMYRTAKGGYAFKGLGLKKALVMAGYRFGDEKSMVLKGAIQIKDRMIEIKGAVPTMNVAMGRLSSAMGRGTWSPIYRAEFEGWYADVRVAYNPNVIKDKSLINLFNMAGFGVGIGDWRTECNGDYGQFKVEKVDVVEDK